MPTSDEDNATPYKNMKHDGLLGLLAERTELGQPGLKDVCQPLEEHSVAR